VRKILIRRQLLIQIRIRLALGQTNENADLAALRRLWSEQGSMDALLRPPFHGQPASFLRGDYFHEQLLAAMKNPQAHALPGGDAAEDPEKMLKELVKLVTRPDMERQVKTFVARQMDQMQDAAMGLDGPGGSVILTERNKAAVKVLDETIKSGKKTDDHVSRKGCKSIFRFAASQR